MANNKQQTAVGLLIEQAHKEWGEYKKPMTNNKQETIEEAAERILSKEGVKLHPSGLETYLKGNVINAMVEMVKWFEQVKK